MSVILKVQTTKCCYLPCNVVPPPHHNPITDAAFSMVLQADRICMLLQLMTAQLCYSEMCSLLVYPHEQVTATADLRQNCQIIGKSY